MNYLLALIGFLFTSVVYLFIKKRSAEGLLENQDTKSKVLDLEAKRQSKKAEKQAEELKRDLLNKSAEERKNEPVKPEDFT